MFSTGVAEQVEVAFKLVQTLRLKLLKQPLGSPREPSCIMQCLGVRNAGQRPHHKPLPSIRSMPPPTAGVDEVVAPVAEATAEAP